MLFNALCISSIPLDIENINTNNDDNDSSSEIKSAELSTTQSSLIVDMNNSSTEPANSGNYFKFYCLNNNFNFNLFFRTG